MGVTRVRIKLDFVITIPTNGDHTRTAIPWLWNAMDINALIVEGLAKRIPTAVDVLPGAHCEVTNIDFLPALRAQRKAAKEAAKEARRAAKLCKKAG